MDNSNEFRLMLDKAVESEPVAFKNFDRTKNVQAQLQEMMYGLDYQSCVGNLKIPEKTDMWSVMPRFLWWAFKWEVTEDNVVLSQGQVFSSMEQLWLAFVMSERYQKKWDGNDWITS